MTESKLGQQSLLRSPTSQLHSPDYLLGQEKLQQEMQGRDDNIRENNGYQDGQENEDFYEAYQNTNEQLSYQNKRKKVSSGNTFSNSKQNIEQRENIHQQILQMAYLNDHYQLIVKPITRNWLKTSLIFCLIFILIKIIWIFQSIQDRRSLQESFIKTIMSKKLREYSNQCAYSFSFLDEMYQIFEIQIDVNEYQDKNETLCTNFSEKYLCENSTINITLLKLIDINYQLISSQLAGLISQQKISNVFIFNKNNNKTTVDTIEFNLTKVIEEQMPQWFNKSSRIPTKKFSSTQVNLLTNYIHNYIQSSFSKTLQTYLDSSYSNQRQNYQWWDIYTFNENKTGQMTNDNYDQRYHLYCFQMFLEYSQSISEEIKACVSIEQYLKYDNYSNFMFMSASLNEIILTPTLIKKFSQQSAPLQDLYSSFSLFISASVSSQYPEYATTQQSITSCFTFYENFYSNYVSQNQTHQNINMFGCYNSQYFHLLVSKYIFGWYQLMKSKRSYHKLSMSILFEQQFIFEIVTFSNATYYGSVHQLASAGIEDIEFILKFQGSILLLIFISFQMSKSFVKNQILGSLSIIKKLGRLVKSTQEVNQSKITFSKILNQLKQQSHSETTTIFGMLIGYFKKFLWIKKIYYQNKKYSNKKYKKLQVLNRGLQLFKYSTDQIEIPENGKRINDEDKRKIGQGNSNYYAGSSRKLLLEQQEKSQHQEQDKLDIITHINYQKYPSVLIYIYSSLIALQQQRLISLQNIKMISLQKRDGHRKQTNPLQNQRREEMKILNEIKGEKEDKEKDKKDDSETDNRELIVYDQYYDPEQQPPISILNKVKSNRGVRFSNQIQMVKGFGQKKSHFRTNVRSNSSIGGKKSSLKSLKSIESEAKRKIDDIQKASKSEQDSVAQLSKKKISRQATIKNILSGQESVHQGLKSLKFDDTDRAYDNKQFGMNHYNSLIDESIQDEPYLMTLTPSHIHQSSHHYHNQSIGSYQNIIYYYEELITIKQLNLAQLINNHLISYEEQVQKINEIYKLQVVRLKKWGKHLKILINQQQQNTSFEFDIQQKIQQISLQQLKRYEQKYEIDSILLNQCLLQKMKIMICLGQSIDYKELEQLCESDNENIKLQASYMYAEELNKLNPFFDFEVISKCYNTLAQYQTTISFKRKSLELIIKTLATSNSTSEDQDCSEPFKEQINELELIKRFYNLKHKKFYFIADMTETYDIFSPILIKIYELMGKMDLMHIFNLGMNEDKNEMQLVKQIMKPKSVQVFMGLFEQLTIAGQERSRSRNSAKVVQHSRMSYEKDFNEILKTIQSDNSEFSSFLVLILGGDISLSNHSSSFTNDDDSSGAQQKRQYNQQLYSQINKQIQKNYYHMMLIGTNLSNYQTKQGKIKKHVKSSVDLLEIDLSKKNIDKNLEELEKFIIQY